MSNAAQTWARRLATVLGVDLDCQVAEPPYSTEDLDCKGYWMRPVARSDDARVKTLRKQIFASLISVMDHVTRWKPDIILGIGREVGGVIAAAIVRPLVLEAACRSRVTPLEVMREYREAWSNVRAVVIVDPVIMPQRTELTRLVKALPELTRLQPAGVPCEILLSKGHFYGEFARGLGGVLPAPIGQETFNPGRIMQSLLQRPAVIVEDVSCGGLCCICNKKGALGRCPRCGLLMHHGCSQPMLPGRPQPCPVCDSELEDREDSKKTVYPHEMQVGAPRRKYEKRLPFVGIDSGQHLEMPFTEGSYPTDAEAQEHGYRDAAEWYAKAVAPSL